MGIKTYAEINLTKSPHLAVLGNSGSGKTYLLCQILARFGMIDNIEIWLADFKNSGDYGEYNSEQHKYYDRRNYTSAIYDFENVVNDRIEKRDLNRDLRILCLEEYGSFLNSLEKKESEPVKKTVANLLFMSRFVNCFVIICSQRLFAEQLIYGSRDSLCNVIMLADPSSESLHSFCTSDEIKLMKPHGQGEGYLIQEGKKPIEIIVPTMKNPENAKQAILRAITK